MRVVQKKFVLTLFPVLLCAVNSAWAVCEAEISKAIDADAEWARPRIEEQLKGYRPGMQRVQNLEERIIASRDFWESKSRNAAMKPKEEALGTFNQVAKNPPRPSSDTAIDNIQRTRHLADLCIWREASSGNKGSSNQSGQLNQRNEQPSGEAQQQSQQAQQSAQQNQARADQLRQGKRKTNDPAAQAHECVAIDQAGSGNYGAFKNTCGYKVNFTTCNYKPRTIQGGFNWSADFDCEKSQFGLHTPDAGRSVAAHNRNTEMVYWFACKAPATPVDAAFVVGKGIEARCHN